MIGSSSKVRRNPEVVSRALDEAEGGVLLHLASGQYHGVNPIGLAIWELIAQERTVREVADALRERIDDPPPDLESDVIEFLTKVHDRDLVLVA
jgi:hypothetical protein